MILDDWRMRAINDGRGFQVDIGAFSTPITGGGDGTILDQDQPECCISIPTGTSIIPIRIDATIHIPLLGADVNECEVLCAADVTAANPTVGTATAETALNLKTKHARTSVCTCRSAFTADTTNPTLGMEIMRQEITGDVQTAAGVMWTPFKLLYIPTYPPIIDGPAAIYLYWGGTVAVTGFACIEWLEYPTTSLTNT